MTSRRRETTATRKSDLALKEPAAKKTPVGRPSWSSPIFSVAGLPITRNEAAPSPLREQRLLLAPVGGRACCWVCRRRHAFVSFQISLKDETCWFSVSVFFQSRTRPKTRIMLCFHPHPPPNFCGPPIRLQCFSLLLRWSRTLPFFVLVFQQPHHHLLAAVAFLCSTVDRQLSCVWGVQHVFPALGKHLRRCRFVFLDRWKSGSMICPKSQCAGHCLRLRVSAVELRMRWEACFVLNIIDLVEVELPACGRSVLVWKKMFRSMFPLFSIARYFGASSPLFELCARVSLYYWRLPWISPAATDHLSATVIVSCDVVSWHQNYAQDHARAP